MLTSGTVLAIGGFQGVSTTFETNIEKYDPSTSTWSTVGALPAGTVYCAVSAFLLPSGKVFLDGSYLFDPVALTATPTTNTPPYTQETFVQLVNGDVLALPPKSAAAPNAYVYRSAGGLWTEVGSPGFLGCRGFLLSSGEVLVVGGSDANGMSQAMGMIYHP
jgi:Kelch motif protein